MLPLNAVATSLFFVCLFINYLCPLRDQPSLSHSLLKIAHSRHSQRKFKLYLLPHYLHFLAVFLNPHFDLYQFFLNRYCHSLISFSLLCPRIDSFLPLFSCASLFNSFFCNLTDTYIYIYIYTIPIHFLFIYAYTFFLVYMCKVSNRLF